MSSTRRGKLTYIYINQAKNFKANFKEKANERHLGETTERKILEIDRVEGNHEILDFFRVFLSSDGLYVGSNPNGKRACKVT